MNTSTRSPRYLKQTENTISLSFLDVISNGLGATIFLFLMFGIIPSQVQMSKDQINAKILSGQSSVLLTSSSARYAPLIIHVQVDSQQLNDDQGIWENYDGGSGTYFYVQHGLNPNGTIFALASMSGVSTTKGIVFSLDSQGKVLPKISGTISLFYGNTAFAPVHFEQEGGSGILKIFEFNPSKLKISGLDKPQ